MRWEYARVLSGQPDPLTASGGDGDEGTGDAFAAFDQQLAVVDPGHDHTDVTGPKMSHLMRTFFDRHAKGDK